MIVQELIKSIPIEIVKNLDKKFNEIKEVFPEFSEYLDVIANQVGTCTSCSKNSNHIKVLTAIFSVGGFGRNLEKISFLGETFINAIKNIKKDIDLQFHFTGKRGKIYPHMRKSCLDCVRKHLGMAVIYLEEYISDNELYRFHYDDAMAHLAHAEVESMEQFPGLAKQLRAERLSMVDNYYNTFPDLRRYYEIINNLSKQI